MKEPGITMKPVTAQTVMADLVMARINLSVENYASELEKVRNLSSSEQMMLAGQADFPLTWKELFEDGKTEWFEAEFPSETDFVNKVFDPKPGRGFMTRIGLTHSELVRDYQTNKTKEKDREVIDAVRKKPYDKPRIIVLTRNFSEYTIFDGAHRAVAFTIEGKKIPVFIGKREKFESLSHFR